MTAPHAAWAQLDENLAWRRAACRIAAACSADEAAKGSVLKFMQSSRFGSLLPRPKGSLNSYLDALPELSAAIVSYVRQAGDAFYAQAPSENVNYGGRGAGQLPSRAAPAARKRSYIYRKSRVCVTRD